MPRKSNRDREKNTDIQDRERQSPKKDILFINIKFFIRGLSIISLRQKPNKKRERIRGRDNR